MWEQKLYSTLRKVEQRKELCKSRSVVMRYRNVSFQWGCIHGITKTLQRSQPKFSTPPGRAEFRDKELKEN